MAAELKDGNEATVRPTSSSPSTTRAPATACRRRHAEQAVADGGTFADIVNETTAEVDAIFTGHTHKRTRGTPRSPACRRTRPILQTGSYGENVGQIS